MLMVQLKQQSDDLVASEGTAPNIAKSVRHTAGPTLNEQALRTMKSLNEEIYQIAASLADCVDEIKKRFIDEPDDTAAAFGNSEVIAWSRDIPGIGRPKLRDKGLQTIHPPNRIPSMLDRLLHAYHHFVVPCRARVW